MAVDSTREARRAALARMKAFPGLVEIVPAVRIFGQSPAALPDFPFVRWGSPSVIPRRAACLDGSEVTCAIHGFAKQRRQGVTVVETAEDHASRLGAQIAKALDGYTVAIAGGRAAFLWTGSQLLDDPTEADAFHCVVNFRIRCST